MDITPVEVVKKYNNRITSARKRGIPCTLTQEDMFSLFKLNNGYCDYTGVKFSNVIGDPFYPSVERINDEEGYFLGNICLVTVAANRLKDEFFDKKSRSEAKLNSIERELLAKLKQNITESTLQNLKMKYTKNTITVKEGVNMSELKTTEAVVKKLVKRPDDLNATGYYTKFCKALINLEKDVDITFAQFKIKYSTKRCKITGDLLEENDKFMLVLDKDGVVNKDNVVVTSEKLGLALNKMREETGVNLKKLLKIS